MLGNEEEAGGFIWEKKNKRVRETVIRQSGVRQATFRIVLQFLCKVVSKQCIWC